MAVGSEDGSLRIEALPALESRATLAKAHARPSHGGSLYAPRQPVSFRRHRSPGRSLGCSHLSAVGHVAPNDECQQPCLRPDWFAAGHLQCRRTDYGLGFRADSSGVGRHRTGLGRAVRKYLAPGRRPGRSTATARRENRSGPAHPASPLPTRSRPRSSSGYRRVAGDATKPHRAARRNRDLGAATRC